ncbi:hypothetical protein [Actinomadura atramentaria]|uniref:hypothetical protein n=1 Tax=Actinomadura atramentaria TaxID=1990 RepID=UPI0003637143|nr:hypothetical protein [Actinomadura atramentaria]
MGEAPRPYIPQYQRLTYLIRLQQLVEVMDVAAALDWTDGYAVLTVTPTAFPGRRMTVECVYQKGVGTWWFRDADTTATVGTVNDLVMVAHTIRNLVLEAAAVA